MFGSYRTSVNWLRALYGGGCFRTEAITTPALQPPNGSPDHALKAVPEVGDYSGFSCQTPVRSPPMGRIWENENKR